jgi:hypothetical protein
LEKDKKREKSNCSKKEYENKIEIEKRYNKDKLNTIKKIYHLINLLVDLSSKHIGHI